MYDQDVSRNYGFWSYSRTEIRKSAQPNGVWYQYNIDSKWLQKANDEHKLKMWNYYK